jgi:hypothetical protein
MLDQCGVADVDDGVVEGGVGDANFKIVDGHSSGHAAQKSEQPDV